MPLANERDMRAWHAANVTPRRKQAEMRAPQPTDVDLDSLNWRERKDRAQALSEEQKLKERQGELVERSVVLATWASLVAAFRARMVSLPSKLAPQVAAPGKVRQAEELIETAVHEALAEVAGDGLPD
jgi:hypothetical protein